MNNCALLWVCRFSIHDKRKTFLLLTRLFDFFRHPKATSCRAAIRTAKGIVADIGEESAQKSVGLLELARGQEETSERDVRKIVEDYQLTLPIERSEIPTTPGVMYKGSLEGLSLMAWLQFFVHYRAWHMLCGLKNSNPRREQQILLEFWKRFRRMRPTHSIFRRRDIDLSRCIPLLIHGDEGRGRKKAPFLCISYYSYIGFGTKEANKNRKKEFLRMRLNYSKSSHLHRLLSAVLPKMVQDDVALKDVLNWVTADACNAFFTGVKDSEGNTYTACVLQCCGDWVWLVKAGALARSFYNCEKRPRAETSNPKGICHLCTAGQLRQPWECFRGTRKPHWLDTMFTQSGFGGQPALNAIPYIPGQQEAFYTFDLFHSYHLGLGKAFVAGCLAMASDYMWAGSVDARLEQLSQLWLPWCRENRQQAYLNSLTRPVLGWMDRGTYPNGYWSKGATTACLGSFFEWWAGQEDLTDDTLMQLALETSKKISKCLRILYRSDVWLSREDAEEVSTLGLEFLQGYGRLATQAFKESRALFPHLPKAHALEHIFYQLRMDLDLHVEGFEQPQHFLSPLNHSVQISEDYVGRTSRLARRTSAIQVVRRVLQRSLQASYKHWRKNGYIKY